MRASPRITKVEVTTYEYTLPDLGKDYNTFNMVYEPGGRLKLRGHVLSIHTDQGIVGEYPGVGGSALAQVHMVAGYLIGKDALAREVIYNDLKRGLRQHDRTGVGVVDICLWDIAGKFHDAPIYRLLGGTRKPLPCYASTLHGDEAGGLTTPEQFCDFAEQCREMGYPAFKIHGWGIAGRDLRREIDTVLWMGERLGGRMDLMTDPACEIERFAQVVVYGRACDEAGFFWLEDPFRDGGVSQFAHRKLRQLIRTPLLLTEHVRLLEHHVDFIVADGTDFVRAGAHEDGGITGAMKIAHAAEGFGLDVELHGPGPVHRHVMSSIRNTNYYELGLVHPRVATTRAPVWADYNDDLDAIDADGCVYAPEGPGIGVPLDWDWINAHTVDRGILAAA